MSGSIFRIIHNDREYSLGNITNVSREITVTMIDHMIPIQPSENRFVVDNGNRQTIDVSFTRVMPQDVDDTGENTQWSNGKWLQEMVNLINRWQMESDGVEIYFLIKAGSELYPSIGAIIGDTIWGLNAYISEFSPKYDASSPYVIKGTIKFTVGGINANVIGNIRPTVIYHNSDNTSNFGYMYDASESGFTVASIPQGWTGTKWFATDSDGHDIELIAGSTVNFSNLKLDANLIYTINLR